VLQVVRYTITDTDVRSTCLNVRLLSNDPHHGRVFYGTFFAFAFVLPMTLISVLYARMIMRLLRGHGSSSGGTEAARALRRGGSSESARARRRVTRLVVVVVAAFGACWLPIHIVFIVQYFHASGDESKITQTFVVVRLAANCLAYANSCLNPILYAFLSESFRSGLVCLCRRNALRRQSTGLEVKIQRVGVGGAAGANGGQAMQLLVAVEERRQSANEAVKLEDVAVQTTALLPAYANARRQTETSAVVETVL